MKELYLILIFTEISIVLSVYDLTVANSKDNTTIMNSLGI